MSPLFFVLIYICAGYALLYATWIFSAFKEKRVKLIVGLKPTLIIQSTLNLMHLISGLFFPLDIMPDIPIRSFGLTMFTVGVWLAIWARITMGKSWNIPGKIHSEAEPKLIKDGPFAYSRNPIYVGMILISFGMAIALKSIFFLFSFFLYIHLYIKIREEEKSLQTYFQDDYTKYRLEVPRFI